MSVYIYFNCKATKLKLELFDMLQGLLDEGSSFRGDVLVRVLRFDNM